MVVHLIGYYTGEQGVKRKLMVVNMIGYYTGEQEDKRKLMVIHLIEYHKREQGQFIIFSLRNRYLRMNSLTHPA